MSELPTKNGVEDADIVDEEGDSLLDDDWSRANSKYETGPTSMSASVVFARIGWMEYYDVHQFPDDELIGGGSFNEQDVGSESENFRVFGDHMLGYVETRSQKGGLNIYTLSRSRELEQAEDVLVIFVAKHPTEGGQRIVGWYSHATCYAEIGWREHDRDDATGAYNMEARAEDCVLLPLEERNVRVPKAKGAMGQSNVFYANLETTRDEDDRWIKDVVRYVRSYDGPNVLAERITAIELQRNVFRPYHPARETVQTNAPEPFTTDPNKLDRALVAHARLQNLLANLATNHGYEVVQGAEDSPCFDLGWIEESGITVVEVKSITEGNETHQLRYGLGQLLDYRYEMLREFTRVWAVLAIERAPSTRRWEAICAELGVHLVWPETFPDLFNEEE